MSRNKKFLSTFSFTNKKQQQHIVISMSQWQCFCNEQVNLKNQINILNNSLLKCEKKWSKIVKNIIKENTVLKNENQQLKKLFESSTSSSIKTQ